MATGKYFLHSLALLLVFIVSSVLSEKVLFDLHSDHGDKWPEVTCLYNDDYNDFWVFGYPVELTGDEDQYPSKRGFWTPGHAQRCEMHYYGGYFMPITKGIRIAGYARGTPEIVCTSKERGIKKEIKALPEGWFDLTFDLSENPGLAFEFTLVSGKDDILLLDLIEFDLGDDTTVPTEPPPPTTVKPITGEGSVVLDNNKDYWILWEPYCHYIEEFSYLWAYGCEEGQPGEDDLGKGYWLWHSCIPHVGQSCKMIFTGKVYTDQGGHDYTKFPEAINVRSYVNEGIINVTLCTTTGTEDCTLLGEITDTGGKWTETSFPVEQNHEPANYQVVVRMVTSQKSTVFLDKIELVGVANGDGDASSTPSSGSTDGEGGDSTPVSGSTDGSGGDSTPVSGSTDGSGGDSTPGSGSTDGNGGDSTPGSGSTDGSGGDSTPGSTSTEGDGDSAAGFKELNWFIMLVAIIMGKIHIKFL